MPEGDDDRPFLNITEKTRVEAEIRGGGIKGKSNEGDSMDASKRADEAELQGLRDREKQRDKAKQPKSLFQKAVDGEIGLPDNN